MDADRRLRWRCRRGMKELDTLLEAYLDRHLGDAGAAERAAFDRLLDLQDPELYRYLSGQATPGDPALADVLRKVRGALHP